MRLLYWGEDKSGYRQSSFIEYVEEKKYDVIYSGKVPSVKRKLEKNILQYIYEIKEIPKIIKADVVYLPPMEHTALKIMLCKLFRKKIICDIYAPIYDMTVNDEKIYTPYSIMGRRYYFRDKICMKMADQVLFLNDAERQHFICSVNLKEKDVSSTCVPLVINKKQPAKLKFYKKERGYLSICWTGSFVALQGVECIIDAMFILKEKNLKAKLYIIGPPGERANYYKQQVQNKQLSDCIEFLDLWGDMKQWEKFIIDNCDVSLGIFGGSDKAKCVVGNKVIDGIIAKTPVITGKSKGLDLFFNQDNDIYTVDNTPDALAKKIIQVANSSYHEIENHVENAFDIYEKIFSKKAYKKNMEHVFEKLGDHK